MKRRLVENAQSSIQTNRNHFKI